MLTFRCVKKGYLWRLLETIKNNVECFQNLIKKENKTFTKYNVILREMKQLLKTTSLHIFYDFFSRLRRFPFAIGDFPVWSLVNTGKKKITVLVLRTTHKIKIKHKTFPIFFVEYAFARSLSEVFFFPFLL